MKTIRLIELFAGYGSQAMALKRTQADKWNLLISYKEGRQ